MHQAKRQRTGGPWSIDALITAGILQGLGALLADPTTNAIFVSGTGADELRFLSDRSRRFKSHEPYREDLSQKLRGRLDRVEQTWNLSPEQAFDRLQRMHVRSVDHDLLREDSALLLGQIVTGNQEAARELLIAYLDENLNRQIDANELWLYLESQGHQRRSGEPDVAIGESIKEGVDRYRHSVARVLPGALALIARPEVGQIVDALSGAEALGPVVVLGPPGSGKSTVISAVIEQLQSSGAIVAALRLDQIEPVATAAELGGQEAAGFGGSPAITLKQAAAAGELTVLVIDQLDAFSTVSGQGNLLIDGLAETLVQAGLTQCRVLVACRAYDYEHDFRLRGLLGELKRSSTDEDPGPPITFDIGDLSDPQLQEALDRLGVTSSALSPELLGIVHNPFNLSVLARVIGNSGSSAPQPALSALRTRLDLLVELDRINELRIDDERPAGSFSEAVGDVVSRMSSSGRLSLPESQTLWSQRTVRDALVHDGVLVEESGRFRFFHQSYFEYRFARAHIGEGKGAAEFLENDPQDVIRRGQLRSVLALERDDDEGQYEHDLGTIIFGGTVRPHLIAVALETIGEHELASVREIELLRRVLADAEHPLRYRALRVLVRPGCARQLAAMNAIRGLVHSLLDDGTGDAHSWPSIDDSARFYLLEFLTLSVPAEVADAYLELVPLAPSRLDVTRSILSAVFKGGVGSGGAIACLFVALCGELKSALANNPAAGELLRATDAIFSIEGVHALHKLALTDVPLCQP